MDFYITKYQGKPMESLTPLFKCLTEGVHRFERQEAEEEAAEEQARISATVEPARKKPKTREDLARRCRRLTIRLASMANRCFWLSAAELLIHVFADGDCLQSHRNITVFTKQLQWAMQQCKKIMNAEIPEESREQEYRNVEAVSVVVQSASAIVSQHGVSTASQRALSENEEESDDDVDVVKIEACTTSTNASDDYAHRGPELANLTLYTYRMYVRRVPKPRRGKPVASTIFLFEKHYALSTSYAQEVALHTVSVPTIDGLSSHGGTPKMGGGTPHPNFLALGGWNLPPKSLNCYKVCQNWSDFDENDAPGRKFQPDSH